MSASRVLRSSPVSAAGLRRAGTRHHRQHAPRVPFALLVAGLVAGGMCALLALNTASAANELTRHNLASRDSDVAARLEQVRNEVAARAAPGWLGSAAAALGMVPAGAPAFLKIGKDGKVVLLGSPAPATSAPPPPAPRATPKPTVARKPATGKHKTTAKAAPKTPTPTPTPTTSLPGGAR